MGDARATVWVFNGVHARFPAAVFSSRAAAEDWISRHQLSGTLTEYPVDVSAYDWAIQKGYFEPKRSEQRSGAFMARFTSAGQAHDHYEDGRSGGGPGERGPGER